MITLNVHHESEERLEYELEVIARWEKDQRDLWFWEKIGRIPFALLDRVTPRKVHEWIGQALDELGSYIQTGGQYLINDDTVLNHLSTEAKISPTSLRLEDVSELVPLSAMNQTSDKLKQARVQLATLQGATTGVGGIFTLAIDIPFLLGLSLKAAQEMALAYGYDPREKKERIFIVQCLQFASSDYVGKQSILKSLSVFHEGSPERETLSQIQGWREVIATYRDNFGWKKLFQLIPIAGILFGAWINKSTVEEVSETAQMLYKKRRVLDRLQAIRESTLS
ncbi:EcsC family protein [Salinithrix halophila]|uniref:EcsC family protein n=1 Tax=Salinithrix halophila TaxID=1485204 RepID=A0ABV8JGW7_9BACL